MAVFLINICKFNGCGITFPSLGDLIQHIEDTHIGKRNCRRERERVFENIFPLAGRLYYSRVRERQRASEQSPPAAFRLAVRAEIM